MTEQQAENDEHWHSTDGVGPYRCRGCNGSKPVLTAAQVTAIRAGEPVQITAEQWQAVIDRRLSSPPGLPTQPATRESGRTVAGRSE